MSDEVSKKNQHVLSGFNNNQRKKTDGTKTNKRVISDRQRKIDHLSSLQKYELNQLHKELNRVMVANSNVTRSGDPNKRTKKDARKGGHSLEVHGIWSSVTFERYMRSNRTFLKFCYENYNVKRLRDVKPKHIGGYISQMLEKGLSAKTVSSYLGAIKKLAECTVKQGIKSHSNLVNDKHRAMVPIARKSERRRGSPGGVGYSYREARLLMNAAKKENNLFYECMMEIFVYSAPRISELLKISYSQIHYENNCIIMNKKNQCKNGRPRLIPVSDETLAKLKALEESFTNKETNIWGHQMSEKQVRNYIKKLCKSARVGYKGVHDLRKASVDFYQRELKMWSKQELVDGIMKFVNVDPLKLNPMVRKGGILKPRFVTDELLEKQHRWLVNQYLAQLLGHSRQDASCPYKRG